MAEDELDGFENLDDLFGEGEGGDESAAVTDGIDDLLGDTEGEGAEGGGTEDGGEGTSDSELDSFFEDLSTIDDLEMTQEEAPAEEAEAVAAPVAAAEPAAAEEPERPAKKEKKKGGIFGKLIKAAIVLLILGGGGYGVYYYFFPSEEVPWEVADVEEFIEETVEETQEIVPPPPPPPAPVPVRLAPAPPPPPPAEPEGAYGIQVATCFFPSCVSEFRKRLTSRNLSSIVKERSRNRQMLEVFSKTAYEDRDRAQAVVERINREHRLEGQAYVRRDNGSFHISMGNFTDLERATDVKDALNQRLQGTALFTTKIRNFPYKLKLIVAGNFTSRKAAQAARRKLVQSDARFGDSFVVKK